MYRNFMNADKAIKARFETSTGPSKEPLHRSGSKAGLRVGLVTNVVKAVDAKLLAFAAAGTTEAKAAAEAAVKAAVLRNDDLPNYDTPRGEVNAALNKYIEDVLTEQKKDAADRDASKIADALKARNDALAKPLAELRTDVASL